LKPHQEGVRFNSASDGADLATLKTFFAKSLFFRAASSSLPFFQQKFSTLVQDANSLRIPVSTSLFASEIKDFATLSDGDSATAPDSLIKFRLIARMDNSSQIETGLAQAPFLDADEADATFSLQPWTRTWAAINCNARSRLCNSVLESKTPSALHCRAKTLAYRLSSSYDGRIHADLNYP